MEITKKELSLIDDWVELHQKIETMEAELESLSLKLKSINNNRSVTLMSLLQICISNKIYYSV